MSAEFIVSPRMTTLVEKIQIDIGEWAEARARAHAAPLRWPPHEESAFLSRVSLIMAFSQLRQVWVCLYSRTREDPDDTQTAALDDNDIVVGYKITFAIFSSKFARSRYQPELRYACR